MWVGRTNGKDKTYQIKTGGTRDKFWLRPPEKGSMSRVRGVGRSMRCRRRYPGMLLLGLVLSMVSISAFGDRRNLKKKR